MYKVSYLNGIFHLIWFDIKQKVHYQPKNLKWHFLYLAEKSRVCESECECLAKW